MLSAVTLAEAPLGLTCSVAHGRESSLACSDDLITGMEKVEGSSGSSWLNPAPWPPPRDGDPDHYPATFRTPALVRCSSGPTVPAGEIPARAGGRRLCAGRTGSSRNTAAVWD